MRRAETGQHPPVSCILGSGNTSPIWVDLTFEAGWNGGTPVLARYEWGTQLDSACSKPPAHVAYQSAVQNTQQATAASTMLVLV